MTIMPMDEETRLLAWLNQGRPSDRMMTPDEFLPGGAPRRLPGLLGEFMGAFGGTPDTSQGLIGAAQAFAPPGSSDPVTMGMPPGAPPAASPASGAGMPPAPGVPGGAPGGMPPGGAGATGDPLERALRAVMMYQAMRPPTRLY